MAKPRTRAQQIHKELGERFSEFFMDLIDDYEGEHDVMYRQLYSLLVFNAATTYTVLRVSCDRPETELIRNANCALQDGFEAVLRDHVERCGRPDCDPRTVLKELAENPVRLTRIRKV